MPSRSSATLIPSPFSAIFNSVISFGSRSPRSISDSAVRWSPERKLNSSCESFFGQAQFLNAGGQCLESGATFVGDRKDGLLFCTASGKPLCPRNVLRDVLHPILLQLKQPQMGFHFLRRFRESVLQMSEARALLVDCWMGHENREMGTRYAKQLVENVEWRKEWAEKIGLSFNLTSLQLEVGKPAKAA